MPRTRTQEKKPRQQMSKPTLLLDVASLSCRTGASTIFTGVSFQVNPGELVCIEGGSGKGKSSLLSGIRGVSREDRHYSGDLRFKGKVPDEEARSAMGLVLQNPHSQMISTLVREELMISMDESPKGARRERYARTITMLGLAPLLDRPVRALSSGQKHLVAIGATGIMDVELLMLDEPFLYLDPANIRKVIAYISYLREQGMGVVITSHPGILSSCDADKVVSLDGREAPPLHGPDGQGLVFASDSFSEKQIVLDGVGYGYEGQPLLTTDLSLSLPSGRELWIEGHNGCGKTTLLNILSGARAPERGRVLHRGREGDCRVMTITQNPDRHFFESSVQNEMEAAIAGKEKDQARIAAARDEIQSLLVCAGLAHKKKVPPFKLSFGQKIHLAAAQAVLLRPDFIFVDDIVGFLAPEERENLLAFLRTAMAKTGCGLVFTTSRGCYAGEHTVDVLKLSDFFSLENIKAPGEFSRASRSSGPARPGEQHTRRNTVWKRMFRSFKTPAFDYVAGESLLHRTSPLIKMGINMMIWVLIYQVGPAGYLHMAVALTLYYLLGGLGAGRFVADSRFFMMQCAVFAVFMPLFRWNPAAVGEGVLAGIRVWLFFIPVMVMMRTTTVKEWMTLFARFLSREKNLAVGIAFGLLPCITADAKEIMHLQGQKGLLPEKKDLFHPARLFVGLKAVFIPLLILMEDVSSLAGVSVKLKGLEK